MKQLIVLDLDGTRAASKQPLEPDMGEAIADLLTVTDVAVISGGDSPPFHKQVASRLPRRADLANLWLMPTTGTKLYRYRDGDWRQIYTELFDDNENADILHAYDASLEATGFVPETTTGEGIEDCGSQITCASSDHLGRLAA